MNWKGRRQSSNVDDRRGISGGTLASGGIGTIVIVLLVMLLGGDPQDVLQQAGSRVGPASQRDLTAAEKEAGEFISVVLADTEDVWHSVFKSELNRRYQEPKLVLFSGQVESACGFATAAVGPFYCPGDNHVYLDLSFYETMKNRFGAAGDFAQAYVVAHEVGHHVQNLLGISRRVREMQAGVSKEEANRLSVRLELQADYFAGVWAHHAQKMKNILDRGDLDEALNCAAAIGDDALQKQAQGYVVPESFTHGTSEQRKRWFLKGWDSGKVRDGDTFSATRL